MKVLFVTKPNVGLSTGGIRKKIDLLAECLKTLDTEIVLFDPWRNQIPDVDVVHFFTTHDAMCLHVLEAKKRGIPSVISPVFAPYNIPLWRMRLYVRSALLIPGWLSSYKLINCMFQNADRILPLHIQEKDRIKACFNVPDDKFEIVPNGTDRKFANGDPRLFRDKYGNEPFVLMVGSIDPNKNQLAVIKAVKKTSIKLVIVGTALPGAHGSYVQKCYKEAGDNVIFTGYINYNDPMLASAFAAAKVFALPSYSEVMPQALYQAVQAKCNVIVSNNIPVYPEIKDKLYVISPGNVKHIKNAIETAMNQDMDEGLYQFGMNMPTWQHAAEKIKAVYHHLLKQKSTLL